VDTLEVLCPKCGTKDALVNWRWRCNNHTNFILTTAQGFLDINSMLSQLQIQMDKSQVATFMKIRRQQEDIVYSRM
jgi:hypothetical protein